MQEIKCPKCGEVFQVDESSYDRIAQQVRNKEFEKELKRQKEAQDAAHKNEIEMVRLQDEKDYNTSLRKKDDELSKKEQRIQELQAQLKANETEKALAVTQAVEEKKEELSQKITEIEKLKGELESREKENLLKEKSIQAKYEEQLKDKDEMIQHYKDFKVRLSTKMNGESLEQYCCTQFNSIRAAAFPEAYFEKDNDAKSGSKGDFIYREYIDNSKDDNKEEYISIMFEMKNEEEDTATKRKNEDFFKKLDKDRKEKNCEYAILVSTLEADNDFYNNGIVDVSYKYPKMYVIRPQFFIPVITFLRNAAKNSIKYREELQVVQSQQLDIRRFEENMNTFKKAFDKNYRLASEKFKTAVDEIDKTISHLQKIKDNLLSSENNLRLANDKADELSIKKLTKNAPSVKAMYDELEKNR